jgi:hypothetical protein
VYQATSLVYTDAPTRLWQLVRMLPWMLRHAPVLAVLHLSDIVIPFVLDGAFASWAEALATQERSDLYRDLPLPGTPWQAHTVMVARLRHDPATRAYAARRTSEGKSTREIRRCLKRAVTRQLLKLLERYYRPAVELIKVA